MHLVVFDVDGTLANTAPVDMECFWQAAKEIFRLPSDYPTWVEGLKDVTGVAILSLFCEQALARKISASELDRFKGRFVAILEAAVLKNVNCFRAMPGAADVLAAVSATTGFEAGIATGCFRHSAEFKLRSAGLHDPDIPLASCDDARSREEIMTISAHRAVAKHGRNVSAITYVGDGIWDFQAAQRLGWNFIGIGTGDAAERLIRAGAAAVLPDSNPREEFFDALSKAAIRRQPSGA
jgi:phosphoglycolate phosphatase-like HAD superfamily hydrolase